MEILLNDDSRSSDYECTSWSRATTPVSVISDVSTTDNTLCTARCFSHSPLTRHRFLAAPYSGTGYLSAVICSQQLPNVESSKEIVSEIIAQDMSDKSIDSE